MKHYTKPHFTIKTEVTRLENALTAPYNDYRRKVSKNDANRLKNKKTKKLEIIKSIAF